MKGKHIQTGQSNGTMNDKTNPKFKWVRMLHMLDYHRWHYVKKLAVHKKDTDGRNATDTGINANEPYVCGPYSCARRENIHNAQAEEHIRGPVHPGESCPLDLSPQNESSPPLATTSKGSRAKRIRKMIMKEVTKRRGRHRRSFTCPASSQLTKMDANSHNQHETKNERTRSESVHSDEIPTHSTNQGENKCELCTTRRIECHLGNNKNDSNEQVGEQQLDHINMLFQEIRDEEINNRLPHNRNLGRSVSFQNSKEFLDAMDVLSINKQFFLSVLDDPGPSLRHHFLTQQAAAATCGTKSKSLTKSETFPCSEPSSSTCPSPDLLSRKKKSFSKENSFKQPNGGAVGKRFKDIGQKLKHLINESRKERRRIAMDAVLHKVPYGKKVSEESIKDSPRISLCESDNSFSPCRTKDGNNMYKKESPSLDQSMNRYCQLLQSTSFKREGKVLDSPERSRLRVADGNSSKHAQRDLRRILSSPDLDGSLGHQSEDYYGHLSSRTPNRRITSFNEQKVQDISKKSEKLGGLQVCKSDEDINKYNEDLPSEVDDVENNSKNQSDRNVVDHSSLSAYEKNNGGTTSQGIVEPDPLKDPTAFDGTVSEGLEPAQGLDKSPTFACINVDNDQAETETPLNPLYHSHRDLQVDHNDEAEFNYVKDILNLSGYSGTQRLGTWFSSEQPVDPSLFVELESCSLLEPEYSPSKEGTQSNHLLLFDLINEVLLKIYERSVSYWPAPISSCSRTHPMPKGYRVLEEVWACINWYMSCSKPEVEKSMDFITTRDLAKDHGWMNLQFDAECVALEVEDMIFQDLLTEIVS